MTYTAIVGKARVRKHPNADRLQLASICGEQALVGLNVKEGDLLLYFPADGQLSSEFAEANDLISRRDPDTGEKTGGYFEPNCRVRAQKLRGEISEGFACELGLLVKAGVSVKTVNNLKENQEISVLDDIEICRKYITPQTRKKTSVKIKRYRNPLFAEHFDTKHFARNLHRMTEGSVVWITEKLHGSSGRYGLVLEERTIPNGWWRKLWRHKEKSVVEWTKKAGTRRVEIRPDKHPRSTAFYGDDGFRRHHMRDVWHLLKKGEIIYGEIVGYSHGTTPIMKAVPSERLGDKKLRKLFPKIMTYSYGCEEGESVFFVYRITKVGEDGDVVELSWPQVKKRCWELGLKHVPDLAPPFVYKNESDLPELRQLVDTLVKGPSTIDDRHIREGVCVRIENEFGTKVLKHKSFEFKVLEGYLKDDEDYVDEEEVQG